MPVMLRPEARRAPGSNASEDFDELLPVSFGDPRMRVGLHGSQFWRDEMRMEAATLAFRRSAAVPSRPVDFAEDGPGMQVVKFVEYVESDDEFQW